jgi:hypothetical protein
MNFRKYTLACTLICIIASCQTSTKQNDELILDVTQVANKTANQVTKILGEPDSTYTIRILGNPIFCQLYQPHNIEIQYHGSLATDIVVYGPHGLPFNQLALKSFNLDYKTHPNEFMKDRLMRWNSIDDFSAVSFYNPTKDSLGNITSFNIFFKAKSK